MVAVVVAHPRQAGKTVAHRFWAKVETSDSCWTWMGGKTRGGYGQFTVYHDVKVAAHRFAYELLVGPIPDGLELDHLCRVHECVNPAHLEPVTHAENVRRGEACRISGSRTHCPSGHEYVGENLYVRPSDHARVCRACTREHQRRRRARQANGRTGY